MDGKIKFSYALKKVVTPKLKEYHYQRFNLPPQYGNLLFYRKPLPIEKDIYSYIQFQLLSGIEIDPKTSGIIKFFKVLLIRNEGDIPKLIPVDEKNYLHGELGYVLWNNLDVHKYGTMYYLWDFRNQSELESQLLVVLEDLINYGIPWLEDPNSNQD